MILLDLAPMGPVEILPPEEITPVEPNLPADPTVIEPVAEKVSDFVFLGSPAETVGLVFALALAAAAVFLIAKAVKKNKK